MTLTRGTPCILVLSCAYTMNCEDELDAKLTDWEMSLETEKFPQFHPTAHQIFSLP